MSRFLSACAVVFIAAAPALAQDKQLSNPIYDLNFDGQYSFELLPDQEHFPGQGWTRGTAEYSVTNRTSVPLVFSRIDVEHTCKNSGDAGVTSPQVDAYSIDPVEAASGATIHGKRILEGQTTPCSGEAGGVTAIRVVKVWLSQAHFTPYEQVLECVGGEVPVVMAMIGDAQAFRYFTLDGEATYTAKDQMNLSRELLHKQLCALSGEASTTAQLMAQAKMNLNKILEFTRIWTEACDAKPDRCREGYDRWVSTGPRD